MGGKEESDEDVYSYFQDLGKEVGPEVFLLTVTLVLVRYFAAGQLEEFEKRYPISIVLYGLRMYWVLMILAIYLCMVRKVSDRVLYHFSLAACFMILLACISILCVESFKSYYKCEVIPEKSRVKRIERFQKAVVNFFKKIRDEMNRKGESEKKRNGEIKKEKLENKTRKGIERKEKEVVNRKEKKK